MRYFLSEVFLSLIPNFSSKTSILVCVDRKELLSVISFRNSLPNFLKIWLVLDLHQDPFDRSRGAFGYRVFKTQFTFEIDFKRVHNIWFILSTIVGFLLWNCRCNFLCIKCFSIDKVFIKLKIKIFWKYYWHRFI